MKNKMLFIVIMLFTMFLIQPVFAADISSCDAALGSGVLIDEKIPHLVHLGITIIKIAVPILLVIFGMIDLIKGITSQKDEEIKKGQQIFVKRLIAGVLVFFVFTIVQLIISLVAGDSSNANEKTNIMTCAKCFINGECTTRN